jgi:hypothetical protein
VPIDEIVANLSSRTCVGLRQLFVDSMLDVLYY